MKHTNIKKLSQKIIVLILITALLVPTLSACGKDHLKKDGISIVATIFPEYDWVMQVLGEEAKNADVTLLLDSGVDLHNFQPTAKDMIAISTCDLFIYVGGESDEWAEDALKSAKNPTRVTLNLLEVLGDAVKEEEEVEGMVSEGGEEGEAEADEHVWLSLRNAAKIVAAIRDALISLDGKNAATYTANAASYTDRLNALDARYTSALSAANRKTLLFGDRFPFRYLTDDYGLTYYAAFSGCSAESEASFETVAFLAGKVDELALPAVMTLESGDRRIAETIIASTKTKNAVILSLDSMQSVTAKDVSAGASYLAIMEKNLDVLKRALN